MPAPQKRPDPADGPLAAFAHDLQVLREQAGNPTYRAMARRAHLGYTTLSTAASGQQLPSLTTVLAYVGVLNGDREAWTARWEAVRDALEAERVAESQREGSQAPGSELEASPAAAAEAAQGPAASPVREPGSRPELVRGVDTVEIPVSDTPSSQHTGQRKLWPIITGAAASAAIITTVIITQFLPSGSSTPRGSRLPDHTQLTSGLVQLPSSATSSPTPAPTSAAASSSWSHRATVGIGCKPDYFYSDPGVWTKVGGGYVGDTCATGAAVTAQIDPRAPGHYKGEVNWQFNLQHTGSCAIEVYISDDQASGGTASYFLDGHQDYDPHLANLPTIDQSAHRGEWASLGTWPIPADGWITLTLTTQSVATGSNYTITASQARVNCTDQLVAKS